MRRWWLEREINKKSDCQAPQSAAMEDRLSHSVLPLHRTVKRSFTIIFLMLVAALPNFYFIYSLTVIPHVPACFYFNFLSLFS